MCFIKEEVCTCFGEAKGRVHDANQWSKVSLSFFHSLHFTPAPPPTSFLLITPPHQHYITTATDEKAPKNLGMCEELRETGPLKRSRTEGSVKFGEERWRDVKKGAIATEAGGRGDEIARQKRKETLERKRER